MSHEVSVYIAWKSDPFCRGKYAFQQSWKNLKGYTFPPFCLIGRALRKGQVEVATIILVTPAWQEQPWYSTNEYSGPNLTPKSRKPVAEPKLPKTPSYGKENLVVNCAGSFRKKIYSRSSIRKAVSLFLDSRRKDTISHHALARVK